MGSFIPLNRPSNEVVLDMVNVTNNSDLTFDDISLSTPVPITNLSIGKNTTITLMPTEDSAYYGNRVVNYNRVKLEDLFGTDVIPVPGAVYDHLSSVQLLNVDYGLAINPTEVRSDSIDDTGVLSLVANDGLLYFPESVVRVRDEFDFAVDRFHQLSNFVLPEAMKEL